MYDKLLKTILYVWGAVFVIVAVKVMISNSDTIERLPKSIWDKVNNIKLDIESSKNMKLALIEKYGMTIEGISLCTDDNKSARSEAKNMPSISSISSTCWNGDCKVAVRYQDKIPSKIRLNIKLGHSDNCRIETYNTTNTAEVVAYQVQLTITDKIKEELGLTTGNEAIRFKHDTGFTRSKINGKDEMTFDFDTLLQSDIITVDGKDKITIDFELK